MGNEVKIHHGKVKLNGEVVGSVEFTRSWSTNDLEVWGAFFFVVDGQRYQWNTSCFSYSADANAYIRNELTHQGVEFLRHIAKESTIRGEA
jgi:hypothetical protein